jgi:hypothetical protein
VLCFRLRAARLLTFCRLVESAGGHGIQLDRSLLTALVDRWRPETHTFHLPCGEMAPTLQDVSFLLGLPIDGDAVGPRVVPASWREDLEARFAGVERREDLGWLEPHADTPGPSKPWLLQFQVIDSVPLHQVIKYCCVAKSIVLLAGGYARG